MPISKLPEGEKPIREYVILPSPDNIAYSTFRVSPVDYSIAGDATDHFHSSDRARANHTGTQVMATISDLPTLAAGTYTPTLTNVTNLDSSTPFEAQYMRVGATVTVSGKVTVDATAGAATELGISLPIASNFGAVEDCCGVGAFTAVQESVGITGDITNDRAAMRWLAVTLTSQEVTFTFTYQII